MRVRSGSLLCYRVFDVGDEIVLDAAEAATADLACRRAGVPTGATEVLAFAAPPLVVTLGKRTLTMPVTGITVEADVVARLFDYGAVSVLFEIPMEPGRELVSFGPLCDELYDTPVLEREGRALVQLLLDRLHDVVRGRHEWKEVETYTVLFLTDLEGGARAKDVLAWPELPKLLIGEKSDKPLSEEEQRDIVMHAHSYFTDDLAVIDWNSAFVLEPSGSRAIPEILEFATSQLLELRYYDGVFDAQLARIYEDLAKATRSPWALLRSPYRRLAREVVLHLVSLTELTERVDNALKVVGDFYLARVYQSAVRRFRIPDWSGSIDAKQQLVAQSYDLIKGELDSRRSTTLELVVIALIFIELVTALRH